MPRPGFYFLACPDSALIRNTIDSLCQRHLEGLSPERHVFWAEDGLDQRFWETLTLQGLLGGLKAIVLRRANNLLAADWKALDQALARPNAQVLPFFCFEVAFDRKGPKIPRHLAKLRCMEFARKKGWYWESPGLDRQGIQAYLGQWATARGFGFAPGAERQLVSVLPMDAAALENELAKIELALPSGGTIDASMAELVSYTPDMDIFAFIESLQSGRAPAATWRKVLSSQLAGESMLFSFLGLLVRETRILWQMAVGENVSVYVHFSVRKAKESLARTLGPSRLAAIWDLAGRAELGVKSGRYRPDQALELLVAGLADVFQTRRAPGAPSPANTRGFPHARP